MYTSVIPYRAVLPREFDTFFGLDVDATITQDKVPTLCANVLEVIIDP